MLERTCLNRAERVGTLADWGQSGHVATTTPVQKRGVRREVIRDIFFHRSQMMFELSRLKNRLLQGVNSTSNRATWSW